MGPPICLTTSMKRIFTKLHRFFNAGYNLSVLDMEAGSRWIVNPSPSNIGYLKAENADGRHILLQPASQSEYLLVDDIGRKTIRLHHQFSDARWKPGRMVVETSLDNYQVWIHASRSLPLHEKRHWLKKLKSDPGADPSNRWGRCPGFRNRKKKHVDSAGGFPLAKLIWIDWKYKANIPKLTLPVSAVEPSALSPQPQEGGVCRNSTVSRLKYERGDESATDFAYAIALLRKGMDEDSVRIRLIEERLEWKNHAGHRRKDAYLKRTIQRARQIVEST